MGAMHLEACSAPGGVFADRGGVFMDRAGVFMDRGGVFMCKWAGPRPRGGLAHLQMCGCMCWDCRWCCPVPHDACFCAVAEGESWLCAGAVAVC